MAEFLVLVRRELKTMKTQKDDRRNSAKRLFCSLENVFPLCKRGFPLDIETITFS